MTDCATNCGRPTRDVLALCSGCLWALECDLGDVGWLDEQLEITLARQGVVAEHSDGGRSAERPLPLHTGAVRARSELRAYLVGWVRDLIETNGGDYPADRPAAMADWLRVRINTIAVHAAAGEVHREITGAVHFARRVVDLPANRTTFPVGPCPELTCAGEVRAYIPAQLERPARMECSACESRWDPTQWLRTGRRILARKGERIAYVDVQVAAASLGVSDRTIRRWVESGRLTNHGTEARILVDLGDVERAADVA